MSYVLVTRDSESRGDICSDALLHRETQKMRADTISAEHRTAEHTGTTWNMATEFQILVG
jgi:hypothetical protein